MFILPIDVYPPPKKKKKPKRQSPPPDDANPSEQKARQPAGPPLKQRVRQRVERVRTAVSVKSRRAAGRVRALFTPFRLVLLCMMGIVIATGYGVVQSRVREQAELTLKEAREQGDQAMQERDFFKAERQFSNACEALDILEREDAAGRYVRQMWRETRALSDMLDVPDVELIREAVKRMSDGREAWAEHFRVSYQNRWIVLDTAVFRAEDGSGYRFGPAAFGLELPGGDEWPQYTGADAAFNAMSFSDQPTRVIFAAQLEDCRLVHVDPRRWEIRLRPDSAFLWSNADNYLATGFQPDEFNPLPQIQQLLTEQSGAMGIEE